MTDVISAPIPSPSINGMIGWSGTCSDRSGFIPIFAPRSEAELFMVLSPQKVREVGELRSWLLLPRLGFALTPALMQHRLGIAVGLFATFEYQIAGGLKRDVGVEIRRHISVQRIACILTIDHGGHALQCFHHLLARANAMTQPVGDVLAGDTQCGTILHQSDILDIEDL